MLCKTRVQAVETPAFSVGLITLPLPKRKLKKDSELSPEHALQKAELHNKAEQWGSFQAFFNSSDRTLALAASPAMPMDIRHCLELGLHSGKACR